MRDWESTFISWSKGPGKTEIDRCENAISAIRGAISISEKLKIRSIHVFLQGSYKNRVNVRQDSDVDIGIVCFDSFFPDYPEGTSAFTFGNVNAHYHYSQFKCEVEEALVAKFGYFAVERGNKAFDIKSNSYRVEADVAPFFEHRRYYKIGKPISGVQLLSDNGGKVINWPDQHYSNGIIKNTLCKRRYKRVVRILKKLCIEMQNKSIDSALFVPGFLIECLVWNVPNKYFAHETYTDDVRSSLAFVFNNTQADSDCEEWTEVSKLKYLFGTDQKWTREQAHNFIADAWNYIGFE